MAIDMITTKKDSGSKKKTACQLQALENYYSEEKYPTQAAMEEYAASLNLTCKQIRTWFVERRRKERRENEPCGYSKSLLGGQHKCGSMKVGKKTEVNMAMCRSSSKTTTYSKYSRTMNQESDQSMESMLCAGSESYRLENKKLTSKNSERSSSKEGYITENTPAKFHKPSSLKSNVLQRKYSTVSNNGQHVGQKKHHIFPQVLLSKDYILKNVFRKDGPPLGVEFDSLPSSSCFHTGFGLPHTSQYNQRVLNSRKVLHSPIVEPENLKVQNVTKYGIGKGLMTVWRATNPNNVKHPLQINFVDGDTAWMPFKLSTKDASCRVSKGQKQLKLIPKQHGARRKFQEKKRPIIKGKKVPCNKDVNQKKPHWTSCKLATDKLIIEQPNTLIELVDDEELELRELQAGPNPLRCSAHFASDGKHGCPLCKDMLAKFPPQTVKMRKPFCTRPWETSPETVKKLFRVLQFLYSNAASIEICPFTLDELAQAFTDKDSMLLGKIHVALLKLLLLDVQREMATGLIPRASKDGRFLGFLHFIREQEIDVNIWSQSLNPLTWMEILRQVLVAAGFGSKSYTTRREIFFKERNQLAKYGLRPHTLKSELFAILSEHGSGGIKVTELANASQIAALDLPNTKEEIEQLICSTLSSDITLFEKIAPSAYRLRINQDIKGKEDYQSDSEDSSSVDDDSGATCGTSNNDESDGSEDLNSSRCGQRMIKYRHQRKRTGKKLTEYTEIDESCSAEACILGMMEGEYTDLSIDEKLDALIALVDLTGACSSLRMEDSSRVMPANIPKMQYHGSGAKIKKSLMDHLMLKDTEIVSEVSRKGTSSTTKGTVAKDKSGPEAHPMQSIYLGSDRRYNSYWLFLGPCDIIDPGHRQVYFESSEDGHWEVITTTQALNDLLSALDCRGARESHLFASLNKRRAFLCQAMDDYMTAEYVSHKNGGCYPLDIENTSGDGSSPISDVDNIVESVGSMNHPLIASGVISLEVGKSRKDKEQKWYRMQAFDKWVWNGFYSHLNAVKRSKNSFMDLLARCESCHDLYWRDEKHCRICHTTFELDFDLEEKYAIHVATCRVTVGGCEFPKHKVLPSQLQVLKAASQAIEAAMPEMALSDAWTRLAHKLWVKRLQRTSSLPEFLQVLTDFVGAINEEWLCECASASGTNTAIDEIIVCFQTMPQTTSAIALWMVKLDALIAPQLKMVQSGHVEEGSIQPTKRRRLCS